MTANNEPAADLTEKDRAFRAFVREENMWKVVFYVCTPLALYRFNKKAYEEDPSFNLK